MKVLGVNNYSKGLNVSSMLIIKKELSFEMLVGVLLKNKFLYYLHYLHTLHFFLVILYYLHFLINNLFYHM